jgi:hypothetical protein
MQKLISIIADDYVFLFAKTRVFIVCLENLGFSSFCHIQTNFFYGIAKRMKFTKKPLLNLKKSYLYINAVSRVVGIPSSNDSKHYNFFRGAKSKTITSSTFAIQTH